MPLISLLIDWNEEFIAELIMPYQFPSFATKLWLIDQDVLAKAFVDKFIHNKNSVQFPLIVSTPDIDLLF